MSSFHESTDIVVACRREAQSWIDCGIGDGWPLTQAADEIDRLRSGLRLAEFALQVEQNNHQVALERLRAVDPEWVEMERAMAEDAAYWGSPEGLAELERFTEWAAEDLRRRSAEEKT